MMKKLFFCLAATLFLGACSGISIVEGTSDSGRYDMVVAGGQAEYGPAHSFAKLEDKKTGQEYSAHASGPRKEQVIGEVVGGPFMTGISGYSGYRTAGNCGDCGSSQLVIAPTAIAGAVSENTNTLDGTATINDGGQGGHPPKPKH